MEDDPEDRLPQELQTTLSVCDRAIKGVLAPFTATIGAEPPPEIIYHYTDDNGLAGILQHGTLWLTDIFSLNDPSELRHGIGIASGLIRELGRGDEGLELFADRFVKIVNARPENIANFFVYSFSKADDDLGQWRSYADDGRGYVLGFDTRCLEQAFAETAEARPRRCSAFSVTYDDSKLAEIQRAMIEVVFPHVRALKGMDVEPAISWIFLRAVTLRLAQGCVNASVFFKHPAYKSEREYRFIQLHTYDNKLEAVKFRCKPYRLVRHMEYQWRDPAAIALKAVISGPAADPVTSRQFALDCLKAFAPAMQSVSIGRSKIPSRGR